MMRKVGVSGSDWSQIDERAAKKRKATGTYLLTYLLTLPYLLTYLLNERQIKLVIIPKK